MNQTERDDYDDQPHLQLRVRDPGNLRRAGNCWMFTWIWFTMGLLIVFTAILAEHDFPSGAIIALVIHLFFVVLFLVGSYAIREGSLIAIWLVSILSVLVGIVYGGMSLLIGYIMCVGFMGRPTPREQVMGTILIIMSGGFILLGLVSIFFSLKYAIQKSTPARPGSLPPTSARFHVPE